MKDTIVIIITSVGSTGAQGVIKALRFQTRYPVTLVGVDARANVAGRYLVDCFYRIPFAEEESEYLHALLHVVEETKADALIPIYEQEWKILSRDWPTGNRCRLVCSEYETVVRCTNKLRLADFLHAQAFDVPRIYGPSAVEYPAILKPVQGSGTHGVHRLNNESDLAYYLSRAQGEVLIQKWIEGDEYSIDTYSTLDAQFVGAVPRIRTEVKGGLAIKTTIVREPNLMREVTRLVKLCRFRGPANIQAIKSESTYYFTDINLRFGGAFIASIRAGLDGPLFLLNEIAGDPICYDGYQELTMLRYWMEVYTDIHGNLL